MLTFQPSSQELNEASLVAGLRQRDDEAFQCFLQTFAPQMQRLARRYVYSDDEADDIVQESFIRAAEYINRFEGRSSLSTWLHRITVNAALDYRRRQRPQTPLNELDQRPIAGDLGDVALSAELSQYIYEALATLPQRQRMAISLCYLQGMMAQEASHSLGISPDTVYGYLQQAFPSLRRALACYISEV
ncbi:RNA polymerase sigma factor [Herpetosiphon llansteffanensis]|uniref:RNA polymerase sigma factor n=1 Tax=Herpetosiphon llansteffanensis TaxID=2094568 RepID=UPI000D7C2A04|nr:RNA polymerase sigma factor [Herpetosiphon llansteffanensis]